MAKTGFFTACINHGGSFSSIENRRCYVGGNFDVKYGLDFDRFGYLDLVEIVESFGYVSWDKLWYKIPGEESYFEMSDDKGVMSMLSLVDDIEVVHVYVDGGKTLEDVCEKEVNLGESNEVHDDNDGVDNLVHDSGIWSDVSSEDLEYSPSDDELSDVSLGSLEDISDEEYQEARKQLKSVKNVFDLIDSFEGFEQYVGPEPESDYEISDEDLQSSESDDELFDNVKVKQKRVVYDPKCDHKNLEIVLGMHFQDGLQCRDALTTWAIENKRFIRFRDVNKTKLVAKCNPSCPWRVHASIVQSNGTFIIKSYGGDHKCSKALSNKLVSSKWIANRYLNVFRVKYDLSIGDLRADILHRFGTNVTKDRLYKAKRIAQSLVKGSVEDHYASIRSYVAELRRVDRDGRYELLLGVEGVFKGLYIGLSSLRKGFITSCRPIIGLDGCFLKTYVGGILMCAVGKDGNNGMFPITWAVVEIENETCWTWFLKCLLEDLGIANGSGWTFISDQQKGLENAVANLAPLAEHRNCARHILMNWKKVHKGSTLENIFQEVVYATYLEDFKVAVQKLKAESPSAYEDFMARDTTKFCKAFLSTLPCSDNINNNISETFNSYIKKARGKHVIHMLEDIRCSLMVRQVEKFKVMSKVTDTICPNIRKILEDLRVQSTDCTPHVALNDMFEIHCEADKFIVDMRRFTCTCRAWNLTGIPCMHALSAIHFMERDPVDFESDYYSVSRYLSGYEFGIEPIRGNKMWPEVAGVTVKPPLKRKMPGRPKKKRIRAPEEKECRKKMSKHGVVIKCSTCKQTGHNKRGCKNEAVQSANVQKRKRGRPSKPSEPKDKQHASTSRSKGTNTYRERAIAKKGVGVYVAEGTGNIYFHPSTLQKKVAHVNRFRMSRPKFGKSSSNLQDSVVTGTGTTQESNNVIGQ